MRFAGVIALDGPSGTGKSTVARRLARRVGARYLDTGAMYRAATVAVLHAGVDPQDGEKVHLVVADAQIDISTDPAAPCVWLDGEPVDAEIRSAEVTAAVSAVSAVAEVRAQLVDQQRGLIGSGGIVVEGRDIGSVVWPAARPKVYLTASPDARARRRAGELQGVTSADRTDRADCPDLAAVAADIARRDRLDSSRAVSPLTRPADAIELDTTDLDVDQVVERLVELTVTPAEL